MIRTLEGTITALSDTALTLTIHGVGYLIHTNALRHAHQVGTMSLFHTHLAVRENALDLYGFVSEKELEFFELLLTVPKIGPKSALQILCQADPDLIGTAIILNDAEHLHKVSGIGKKTASNIVTALAGKIDATTANPSTATDLASHITLAPAQVDAIDALITLGYDEKEARVLVLKQDATLAAKELIQSVLKQTGGA